jgi:hypothetical protein
MAYISFDTVETPKEIKFQITFPNLDKPEPKKKDA